MRGRSRKRLRPLRSRSTSFEAINNHENTKGKKHEKKIAMCTGCAGIRTEQGDTLKVFVNNATKCFVSSHEEIFGAVMLMA